MMPDVNVFHYEDPRLLARALFEAKKRNEQGFSLRKWALDLGYKNPSFLSEVLRGKRRLKLVLAHKMVQTLDLDEREREYFELLTLAHDSSDDESRDYFEKRLATIVQYSDPGSLSLDRFRFVVDWFHWMILEMTEVKGFVDDPRDIAKRSRFKISAATVQITLDRLTRLRFLKRNKKGTLEKEKVEVWVGNNVPSEAIRAHHLQFLDLAKESLTTQSVDVRDVAGTNIAIRKEDYKKVKRLLHQLHAELHKLHKSGDGDIVYRINTQAFPLTK